MKNNFSVFDGFHQGYYNEVELDWSWDMWFGFGVCFTLKLNEDYLVESKMKYRFTGKIHIKNSTDDDGEEDFTDDESKIMTMSGEFERKLEDFGTDKHKWWDVVEIDESGFLWNSIYGGLVEGVRRIYLRLEVFNPATELWEISYEAEHKINDILKDLKLIKARNSDFKKVKRLNNE